VDLPKRISKEFISLQNTCESKINKSITDISYVHENWKSLKEVRRNAVNRDRWTNNGGMMHH